MGGHFRNGKSLLDGARLFVAAGITQMLIKIVHGYTRMFTDYGASYRWHCTGACQSADLVTEVCFCRRQVGALAVAPLTALV
jgi:hypothetical protein